MLTYTLLVVRFRCLLATCVCFFVLCLLPKMGLPQTPAPVSTSASTATILPGLATYNITPQMRADDARLNTPITLDAPHISLGQLLDTLSQQSGVMVNMNIQEPVSGLKVFFECDKAPLSDVLDRLWALLSFQDATWKWERSGKAGAYRYEFAQTRASANFPQHMKQLAQEAFEKHAATMIEVAALPPEARKSRIAQLSASMLQTDNVMAQRLTSQDYFNWNGMRLFARALTPQQQKSVLNGGSVSLTLAQLPEELRATFHAGWMQFNSRTVLPNGQVVPDPEPTIIRFERRSGMGIRSFISLMYVDMGKAGALGILGGYNMESGMRGKVQDLWMLPGDSRNHALADRECKKPDKPIPDLPSTPRTPEEYEAAFKQGRQFNAATAPLKIQHRFLQLAHALPAMLLGVLPEPSDQSYDPTTPYDKPVKTFLAQAARNDEFNTRRDLLYKWRGDTLLVIYPTWYLDEERHYPYALAQQVQRAARNGFIPYRELVQIAAQMKPEQWGDLCLNTPLLNDMEGAFTLLQMCAVYPDLLRDNGWTLTDENRQILQTITIASQTRVLADSSVTAVRAQTVKRLLFGMSRSELQVQYLDGNKKWNPLLEYAQKQAVQP